MSGKRLFLSRVGAAAVATVARREAEAEEAGLDELEAGLDELEEEEEEEEPDEEEEPEEELEEDEEQDRDRPAGFVLDADNERGDAATATASTVSIATAAQPRSSFRPRSLPRCSSLLTLPRS